MTKSSVSFKTKMVVAYSQVRPPFLIPVKILQYMQESDIISSILNKPMGEYTNCPFFIM